ncbi:MAG TPA: glycosyltransferase family 2 protein [Nocardioidaceae bacterium]|jgi:glycosyltransferase involved in cell wall biosynthesis
MNLSCDLVLPCRDEAAALPALLARVPRGLGVIVVDNGSVDGTAAVAARHGARVVHEPRAGYGAAVHAGVEASSAEHVAVLDGDGSLDPKDVLPLLGPVISGEADLAVGRRRPQRRGVWPWHARAGNALVLWWLRRRTGLHVHDVAPVRVGRREALLGLDVRDRRLATRWSCWCGRTGPDGGSSSTTWATCHARPGPGPRSPGR